MVNSIGNWLLIKGRMGLDASNIWRYFTALIARDENICEVGLLIYFSLLSFF